MIRSLLVLTVVALFAVATPASDAANSAGFDDPVGDVTGIPDIQHVSATSTDAGRLTFRITFAAPPTFGNGVGFALLVDADANPATGHSDGVDHWFLFRTSDGSFEPGVWDGQQFVPYGSHATGSIEGSTATISLTAKEIGATRAIRYFVASYGQNQEDLAPDTDGTAEVFVTFPLELRPPVSVRFVPGVPRAGKQFRAVGPGISCRASLGGRALSRGCRWRVPVTARGKRLAVKVTNRAGRSRRFVFKVR
ncbi:MAG TPA: hypothetical protein VI142_06820 [Gaiellaceae bacterium]